LKGCYHAAVRKIIQQTIHWLVFIGIVLNFVSCVFRGQLYGLDI